MASRIALVLALVLSFVAPAKASTCANAFFVHRDALSLIPLRATLQGSRLWLRFMIAAPKGRKFWNGFVIVSLDGRRDFALSTRVAALKPVTILLDGLDGGERRVAVSMARAANGGVASDAAFTTCLSVPGRERVTRWDLIP